MEGKRKRLSRNHTNLLLRIQTFVLFLLRKDEGFYLWSHRNKKSDGKKTIRSYKFNVVYFYKEIDQLHNKRDVNGVKDVLSCESIHIWKFIIAKFQ